MARCKPFVYLIGLLVCSVSTLCNADADLQIEVNVQPDNQEFGWVYVKGVDQSVLADLRIQNPNLIEWREMFSVRLQAHSETEVEQLPNLAGRYEVVDAGFRFVPQFTPAHGLIYDIRVNLGDQHQSEERVLLKSPVIFKDDVALVDRVYPSAKHIPENALRFYIHFSFPMSRGQVIEHIHLLDENNDVIPQAFIVGPLGELWDPQQQRLTLLLDPGRIKQGVAPNRELGAALKSGAKRTLVVDGKFKDARGVEIGAEFRKSFQITDAIRQAIDPKKWHVSAPKSGTRTPLLVRFNRPLDSAMLLHSLRVFQDNGIEVDGEIIVSADETEWLYKPNEPWSNQIHFIQVAKNIEDVAGNNVLAPLDVEVGSAYSGLQQVTGESQMKIQFTPEASARRL